MSLKSSIARLYAAHVVRSTERWASRPVEIQMRWLKKLVNKAKHTQYGKDHDFASIRNYDDFKKRIPIKDYEGLKSYIEKIMAGQSDVLWPGKPLYFAKTSGTTSGTKYIPISRESMPYHIAGARNMLLHYIHRSGKADFVDGKMIFLQGSPILSDTNGIKTGRLSGIVAHYVPAYLQRNRMPSWETNCIEDWEAKVEAIVRETIKEDMRLISGIPPWVQMYFERLLHYTGKATVSEVFPNFSLLVIGGVAFEPYQRIFEKLIGKPIDTLELYPASEGFIAYQDHPNNRDLLLLLDGGIFFEFIPADKFFEPNPPRYHIGEVQTGVHYVVILNTNAGLWGYNIGDTIEFTSTSPYRIRVSGRIKHFISAFGEHVIGSEVEYAISQAIKTHGGRVNEFTVAPQVTPPEGGLPYHEWWIEFDELPADMSAFALTLDQAMQDKNVYYKDLITGKILRPAVIRMLPKNAFNQYMKSIGKLGGQNKLPRLSNDRKIAVQLEKLFLNQQVDS
ncbi:MAG: GH3 auxin-responsive promoter family protein [Thermaurantimonas sp.]|uniref:GH3 auxin-responsive promoter family protein n=1 Tax=Thermaurantimonas sp. TaxID=2681568 RepID=UPI00391B4AFC